MFIQRRLFSLSTFLWTLSLGVYFCASIACAAQEGTWKMICQNALDLSRTGVGAFFVIDSSNCLILYNDPNAPMDIFDCESGRNMRSVTLSTKDLDLLEHEVIDQIDACELVRFTDVAQESSPRFVFQTMFVDQGVHYVGWHLKVYIKEEDIVDEDQLAVVSRLNHQWMLVDHKILVPSGISCEEGRFNTRFDLKSRNGMWNDTLFLQRHQDVLRRSEPVYEILSLSGDHKASLFSDYKMDSDSEVFWHNRANPYDQTLYYGYFFINDNENLLCTTGANTDLYYCDTRLVKYHLDCSTFTTFWDLEKYENNLFYITSNRVSPKSYWQCYVADNTGHTVSSFVLESERGSESLPYYVQGRTHKDKFYLISRKDNSYFLQVYQFQ